jgi:hypothetical protein
MFYSFARVSAVLKLKVEDHYHNGTRRLLRLHEKGDPHLPSPTVAGYEMRVGNRGQITERGT